MRLGLNNFSCDDVISKISEKNLFKIFKYFGEDKNSKINFQKIIQKRATQRLQTQDIVSIIEQVKKFHFSKKIPQQKYSKL